MKQTDIISDEKNFQMGGVVKGLIVFLMVIGSVFTGYHTHHLFSRGLGGTQEAFLFAFIPVISLEGAVLLTFAAKFFYFTTVKQHGMGNFAMWVGIIILVANTILNHSYNTGDQGVLKPVLEVYSLIMLPVAPILSIVYAKEILSADPEITDRVERTMHEATINRKLSIMTRDAYNSPQVTEALNAKRDMMANVIAQQIVSGMLSAKGTSQFADYDVRSKSPIALPKPSVDTTDERVSKAAAALSAPSGPTQSSIDAMIQAAVAKALANAQPSSVSREKILQEQLAQLQKENDLIVSAPARTEMTKIKAELDVLKNKAVAMNADAPTQARVVEAQSPK